MPLASILPLALQLLPLIETGVPEFIGWINSLRGAAQQSNEWTQDMEDLYRTALWRKTQDPAYAPDVTTS